MKSDQCKPVFMNLVTLRLVLSQVSRVVDCSFVGCFSSGSHGGSIYASYSGRLEIEGCRFYDSRTIGGNLMGGAIFASVFSFKMNQCCFYFCHCSGYGTSIITYVSENQENSMSLSYFGDSGTSSSDFGAWITCRGVCDHYCCNVSNALSYGREAGGHFGEGPVSNSNYMGFFNCKGPSIFGPYTSYDVSNHENLVFVNNTASNSLIIMWNGRHTIKNSIFLMNTGLVSSIGHSGSTLSLVSCVFDTVYSGVPCSQTLCVFNKVTNVPQSHSHALLCISNQNTKNRSEKNLSLSIIGIVLLL